MDHLRLHKFPSDYWNPKDWPESPNPDQIMWPTLADRDKRQAAFAEFARLEQSFGVQRDLAIVTGLRRKERN